MAMLQKNVNYGTNFSPFVALFWVVLVVTLSSRTVEGAAMAAASFSLFDAIILKGAIFAWLFRGADRIPGFLPISPKWVFVLFGLGAIQYARHPEGLLEYQKRKRALKAREKRERKLALATATSTSPHPDGDVTTTTVDAPAEATAVDEPASVAGEGPGR
jgi:branched-chain amino acid transport system permease protein